MKLQTKKVVAAVLAMTMCIPATAFADTTGESSGSFNTDFNIYSPTLTVSVPLDANIRVNPIAETTASAKTSDNFTVASNSIDIINASVDTEKDRGIPVNATINATITNRGEDVVTEYTTFAENATSTKKKVYLQLSEATATKAATVAVKSGETLAFVEGKLNLGQFEVTTPADYTTPAKFSPITIYGSLLSVDIDAPTTTDTTANATFSTDPTKVVPKVGSFAVTGVANTNAAWAESDLAVGITYNIKASKKLNIENPTIATAPTFSKAGTVDVTITVPNVGEAEVAAIALHNDEGDYGDFMWGDEAYTVDYTTTPGSAIITIPKDDSGLAYIGEAPYKDQPQDLVIGLTNGQRVVTTITVTD